MSHLMHDALTVWVQLFFVGTAYEHQELQFYRMAGARGADFEVFAMMKAKHGEWSRAKSEQDSAMKAARR